MALEEIERMFEEIRFRVQVEAVRIIVIIIIIIFDVLKMFPIVVSIRKEKKNTCDLNNIHN